MACCGCLCSLRTLFFAILLSAVPLAYLASLELAAPTSHVYFYHSSGWFRECSKWDPLRRRFLVSSFSGGISQVAVPSDHSPETVLEEVPVVGAGDFAGNASLGIVVDSPRNRLLVVAADVIGSRFGALLAYDMATWQRLFFTQLAGSGDGKSFADDVAVDTEGNAYVTDGKNSKIWKVNPDGKFVKTIESPLFKPKEWYKNIVGLNGIVHHPDGFLLVIHTFSGNLFKVDLTGGEEVVKFVKVVKGPLTFGDGLEMLSPTQIVVAGNPSARLVESSDGWESAVVTAVFHGPKHRLASAATVKDGKVYLNHLVGMGYPRRKHAIVEAVF